MKRGLVRGSRYSPGNMDPELLEALFVGRQAIMADVVEKMVASVGGRKERHYVLLVGPRGSGKTHFVALAYHHICSRLAAANLEDKLTVAYLNEEEWGVNSYLDFLVRVLRALAAHTPGLDAEIAAVHERFSSSPIDAEALAEKLIARHVAGRTLLLICENLMDLFEALGDEGQKRWRAFIQQSGFWAILATTPTLFVDVTSQEHPFYGFFTLRDLPRIDLSTAREFLIRKATHDGKHELARLLDTPLGHSRLRASHHLAAGNHRAYVVLYDFLDREALDDLVEPFMRMVDDLTPYYQGRMRQLAPAQRKIVEFLCHRTSPATVKEIATQCLMSQQTAAKQLGELATRAVVNRMPIGRRTLYELAEPLMRICIEIRGNRIEHFRLLIEFLKHWFDSSALEERQTIHDETLDRQPGHGLHLRKALQDLRQDLGASPLPNVLRDFAGAIDRQAFFDDRDMVVHVICRAMIAAVQHSGPMQLPEAFKWLCQVGAEMNLDGLLGQILTCLAANLIESLAGTSEEWERAIAALKEILGNFEECAIPLAVLSCIVGFTLTGEQRYLLQLPLEQRQLLERVFSKKPGNVTE